MVIVMTNLYLNTAVHNFIDIVMTNSYLNPAVYHFIDINRFREVR